MLKKTKKVASTKICYETAADKNPYQTQKLYLAGYDIEEIARQRSFIDTIFLMFTGELPKSNQDKELLETLMVLFSIPSPRHPATRAAMNSGICKTNAEHLLPISLMTIGGEQLGAIEVKNCYDFLSENLSTSAKLVANSLINSRNDEQHHIAPGFGQVYGAIDPLAMSFLNALLKIKPESKTLNWVINLLKYLEKHDFGILDVGVAACVFHELSLGARESIGLYQYIRAPGLLAYAMEQTHNPVSAIPLLEDSQYELINK